MEEKVNEKWEPTRGEMVTVERIACGRKKIVDQPLTHRSDDAATHSPNTVLK